MPIMPSESVFVHANYLTSFFRRAVCVCLKTCQIESAFFCALNSTSLSLLLVYILHNYE